MCATRSRGPSRTSSTGGWGIAPRRRRRTSWPRSRRETSRWSSPRSCARASIWRCSVRTRTARRRSSARRSSAAGCFATSGARDGSTRRRSACRRGGSSGALMQGLGAGPCLVGLGGPRGDHERYPGQAQQAASRQRRGAGERDPSAELEAAIAGARRIVEQGDGHEDERGQTDQRQPAAGDRGARSGRPGKRDDRGDGGQREGGEDDVEQLERGPGAESRIAREGTLVPVQEQADEQRHRTDNDQYLPCVDPLRHLSYPLVCRLVWTPGHASIIPLRADWAWAAAFTAAHASTQHTTTRWKFPSSGVPASSRVRTSTRLFVLPSAVCAKPGGSGPVSGAPRVATNAHCVTSSPKSTSTALPGPSVTVVPSWPARTTVALLAPAGFETTADRTFPALTPTSVDSSMSSPLSLSALTSLPFSLSSLMSLLRTESSSMSPLSTFAAAYAPPPRATKTAIVDITLANVSLRRRLLSIFSSFPFRPFRGAPLPPAPRTPNNGSRLKLRWVRAAKAVLRIRERCASTRAAPG